jgi:hypothetical protein
MGDLIVVGYPGEPTAQDVRHGLIRLRHDAVARGSLSGLFWGVLLGLLFLFPLVPLVGMARSGSRPPGELGGTRRRPQGHPGHVRGALWPCGGTVLRTWLPRDAGQQLMKVLHGDDRAAQTWEQPASAGPPA